MQCLGLKRHSRQRGGKDKSLRNGGKGRDPQVRAMNRVRQDVNCGP